MVDGEVFYSPILALSLLVSLFLCTVNVTHDSQVSPFLFFFKNFYFFFILLYNTVLVLPYIVMNPPRVWDHWKMHVWVEYFSSPMWKARVGWSLGIFLPLGQLS